LLDSEKKSLYRFLAIYLLSTFLLFLLAVTIFYKSAKHHIITSQIKAIDIEANHLKNKIRELHQSSSDILYYPRSNSFQSAIFDLDKKPIFSTFSKEPPLQSSIREDTIYKLYSIKPYYLGAAYLLIAKRLNSEPIALLKKNIFLFMLIGGGFFLILGYFLGKLFIKPMKESLQEKNRFIQDATHELNTPISTILTNIELIEALQKCKDAKEELQRIEIASKTLSRIYEDLAYINLAHQIYKKIEPLNFSQLLQERVLYFQSLMEAKNLSLKLAIKENIELKMDKNDALRLIDNLISNAIKYNKSNSFLEIGLNEKSFWVRDGGIGIERKNLQKLFERFKRANNSEGGFGLGLNIVYTIIKEYNFTITIDSKLNIGTKVVIQWEK